MFGLPLFVRPGFEFNGPWYGYTSFAYVDAFRKIVTRFRNAGVHEAAFISCYEPDAPNDFDAVEQGQPRWFPGDDFVDWFGLDVFQAEHFNPAFPDMQRGEITKKGKAERFLRMAREHGKPVFLSETSAQFANITPDAADPGFADGQRDWGSWFRIFFDWMASHAEIKAFWLP